MSEENKAIARRFFDLFDDDGADLGEIMADNFVHHSWPLISPGIAGLKEMMAMVDTGFSDFNYAVEDVIAEGDKVVIRISESGVHTGELLGIPPTGKSFHNTGIHIMRIDNGKIVEHWREQDTMGVMQQLGVVPPLGE